MSTQADKQKNKGLTEYNIYRMSIPERLFYIAVAAAVMSAIAYIFYRSIVVCVLVCPFAFLYPRIKVKELIKRRKTELNIQFKDMLYSLSSSMSAGKPVEAAFRDVLKDLVILYPDPESLIIQEVSYIVRKLEMNEPVEAVLGDFAERADIDDIVNFADVFRTCKRSGGNIVEIIKNTSNIINDKIEIKQEIDTMLAEKKMEQKVLNAMPPAMIIFLSAACGDYIEPVFTTITGRIVTSIAVILLVAAYLISKKIMDIKV